MKIVRFLFLGLPACVFLAACALPVGEDYIIPRKDLGESGGYILDYNLDTSVPLPYTGEIPVVQVSSRGDLEMAVRWKDAAGADLPNLTAFVADKIYTADIQITPKNGYQFLADQPFTYRAGSIADQQDDGEAPRTVTVKYYPAKDRPGGASAGTSVKVGW
jgi:hypothetical protein